MRNLFFLCIILLPCVTIAQPKLVFTCFDLETGSGSSTPNQFAECNGKMFFAASTATEGRELWICDGTQTGTNLLKDIYIGGSSSPESFIELNGKIYFSAADAANGGEIWVSDGTNGGTQLLKDIYPGPDSSQQTKYIFNDLKIKLGNNIVFGADDSLHGYELWISDGTTSGTRMIKDIRTGSSNGLIQTLQLFPERAVYNGKMYFCGLDALSGGELWMTDGTENGTQIVKDMFPGPTSSSVSSMAAINNVLYLASNDKNSGHEWWTSDGTEPGTKILKDINPMGSGAVGTEIVEMNGKVYFAGDDGTNGRELWVTDGTTSGTKMLADINNGPGNSSPMNFTPSLYKDKLFFSAGTTANGRELWVTDGTSAGTKMVKDIISGATGSNPGSIVQYKKTIYFTAEQTPGDTQLFKTDGTVGGTTVVAPPGVSKSNALGSTIEFFTYHSILYFAANYDNRGRELWAMEDTNSYVDISTVNAENEISIFPNPTDGSFVIQREDTYFTKGTLTVYDVNGRTVHIQEIPEGSKEIRVNLKSMTRGVYTVHLQMNNVVVVKYLSIE